MNQWLPSALTFASTLVLAGIAFLVRIPRDHERAQHLVTLAQEVATVAVALNPGAPFSDLLRDVIARLVAIRSVPTTNGAVLERAATVALQRLGHGPGG